jgi:tricorn protease
MLIPLALLAIALASAATPQTTPQESPPPPLLIPHVTVSDAFVVFSYAGDLWRVGRSGGAAQRLTEGPDDDDFPAFAPDGRQLAFSRRGADDWDVYTLNPQGGEPQRLTFHPEADIVRGWSPDGRTVLFASHRDEEGVFRLYSIGAGDPLPTALPLPRGWDGSYAPAGDRLAYVPLALSTELTGIEWPRYRGGRASRIWIASLTDSSVERLPREDSNDRNPMWVGGTIYFVSDRSGAFNLYAYDPATKALEQLTSYADFGIDDADAGGGVIAFAQDGHIRLFDPATRAVETLELSTDPDRSELARRPVDGSRWIESAALAPGGNHVVFGARGEVLSLEPAAGTVENLTGTSAAAERFPVPSPDGRWIAYVSDEAGSYQLHLRPTGGGAVRKISVELRPNFYRELTWAPNSRRIAFSDKRLALWVADVETGGARRVATATDSQQELYQPAWSPDGAWLAYSKYEENRVRAIHLYNADRGRAARVTHPRVDAEHPVFDPGGNYLYFLASNTAGLSDLNWSVLSNRILQPHLTRRLQVVLLRENMPAPLYAIIGEPNPDAAAPTAPAPLGVPPGMRGPPAGGQRPEGAQPAGPAGPPGPRQRGPAPTSIDLSGIEDRIVPLPLPPRDYVGLAAAGPGSLYLLAAEWAAGPTPGRSATHTLYRWRMSQPRELTPLVRDVDEFVSSADGATILYRSGGDWSVVAADTAAEASAHRLDTQQLKIEVDPAAEWRQIYREAWRLLSLYFYDPNEHGLDLAALEQHYAAYLPGVTRRSDLNALLGKALGQVSVSHLAVGGGDVAAPSRAPTRVGLLGADYTVSGGRYCFSRIYSAGHFNSVTPLSQAPLDQPGVNVVQGDCLISVDGEQILATRSIYSYFAGKALAPVRISVAATPDGVGARTYTVVPLPGENTLRRINWAETNRRAVEEESQGILGYIYVPDFSPAGIETVVAQLLENRDRRGLIIDQRFAPGGITADYLIEWLGRRALYYYAFREGTELPLPSNPLPQAKALLINDANASAAETFALMFRLADLGKLIGERTMGAGIGPYGYVPSLIDGGRVTIPGRAAFDPAGSWAIENSGLTPDQEVEWLPADWRAGRDPQLAAAIKAVLQAIVDRPPPEVKKPEYPRYPRP